LQVRESRDFSRVEVSSKNKQSNKNFSILLVNI